MPLAHAISDETEAAYRRGDMFEKRRRLMDAWAEFCSRASGGGEVVKQRVGKDVPGWRESKILWPPFHYSQPNSCRLPETRGRADIAHIEF